MLNLYHLKYFYDAAAAKSLVRAAESNRVSHPAVSQAIRSLEAKLGVKLLVHAKRHFELTSEGALLYKNSEEIFGHLDQLINSITSADGQVQGPLALGCSHSIGLVLGHRVLPSFCADYPAVDLSLRIGNSNVLESLLDSRLVEIGIGVDDGSFSRFEKVPLKKGRFILMGKSRASRGKPAYLVGDKGAEVSLLRSFLRHQKADCRWIEIQSWELIAQLAASGAGLGLVPDYLLETGLFPKAKAFEMGAKLPPYEVCAFFRSKSALSGQARAFLKSYEAASKPKA